jgi:hypothetical protein
MSQSSPTLHHAAWGHAWRQNSLKMYWAEPTSARSVFSMMMLHVSSESISPSVKPATRSPAYSTMPRRPRASQ